MTWQSNSSAKPSWASAQILSTLWPLASAPGHLSRRNFQRKVPPLWFLVESKVWEWKNVRNSVGRAGLWLARHSETYILGWLDSASASAIMSDMNGGTGGKGRAPKLCARRFHNWELFGFILARSLHVVTDASLGCWI